MPLEVADLSELSVQYAQRHPSEILALAFEMYSPNIGISFSGAEDVVLVDMAAKLGARFRVFSLDTGRLHPETLRLLDEVREKYGFPIQVFFPQPEAVEKLVKEGTLFVPLRTGTRNVVAFAKWNRCAAR